jgi:hypothetical protein
MKSGRRAKVQGSGVVRLPWARQINSAFTNSFYSNHVRGRPSVAVSDLALHCVGNLLIHETN